MAQAPDPGSVVLPQTQHDGVDPGSVVLPDGSRPHAATAPLPPSQKLDMSQFNARQHNLNKVVQSTPVQGALGLLQRPGQAMMAGAAGNGPLSPLGVLFRGETPGQYQADTSKVTQSLMMASPEEYSRMNPVRRAANEFATQMIIDPLTYAGGSGLARHAVEQAGLRVIPAGVKLGGFIGPKLQRMGRAGEVAGEIPGWIHDQMTPGGKPVAHAIRELARTQGVEGMKNAERMMSAASGSRSVAASIHGVGKQLIDQALHGTPPQLQSLIFKAIHEGEIDELAPELRPIADRLVQIDRSIPWLMGTKSTRQKLLGWGFNLPKEFAPFDKGPRGLIKQNEIMEHHVPMPHELNDEERAAAFESLNKKPGARAATDIRSRFFQKRINEPPSNAFTDPDMIRETWHYSFLQAGKALGGANMRRDLANMFAKTPEENEGFLIRLNKEMSPEGTYARKPVTVKDLIKISNQEHESVPILKLTRTGKRAERPEATTVFKRRVPTVVRKAFAATKPEDLSVPQKTIRELENLGNLGKSSLFYQPLPHQRNITTLQALANPASFPLALKNYFQSGLGFAKPSKMAEMYQDSIRAGANTPNMEQRGLIDLLEKMGPLGKLAAKVPYGVTGKLLWGWDQAVKDAVYKHELKWFKGDTLRAAAATRRKIVDYSMPTGFQQAMRLAMPFSTWRTAMPQAVATSIAEHPEYALGLMRATHGAIAGAPFNSGGLQQSSNPLSEANELTYDEGQKKYLRGSLSLTAKTAADIATNRLGMKEVPFPLPQLLSRLPVAGQFVNPYGDTPEQQIRFALEGVHPYQPPKWHKYRKPYHHRRRAAE